jgi:hypothetical protein
LSDPRSKWFSRLVSGTKPLPETGEEVVEQMTAAEYRAMRRAQEAEQNAQSELDTAREIKKRVRKPRAPKSKNNAG